MGKCLADHPPDEIGIGEWNDHRGRENTLAEDVFVRRVVKILCRWCASPLSFEPFFHTTTTGAIMHQVTCGACRKSDYVLD